MKKIKSFEDACNALGILEIVPDFSTFPEKYRKAMYAHYKLMVITEALNEGWTPNWDDWEERKYYPWFDMRSSASGGLSFDVCDYWSTTSLVGSRLCFKNRELAEYAGKEFVELYKEYFVLNK